jgi:plastocyanin
VVLSGCLDRGEQVNGTNLTPTPKFTQPFPVPEPSTVYIEIRGSAFHPLTLSVIKGTTVRWKNMDSAQYIVNVDGVNSPPLNKRDTWNYTFNNTGNFTYSVPSHAFIQKGYITVEQP